MLLLDTTYSFSRVPYLTDEALDNYAETVVRDAMPDALISPTILDVGRFVEFYLGLRVEYKRISPSGAKKQILSVIAFDSGIVQVYDDAGMLAQPLYVESGTVVIDPSLMQKRNLPRCRFTFMHESAHWLVHREAFSQDNPFGTPGKFENQYLAAKEGRIDYVRSQKERNDNERIERQADFLASAMLMPKTTLRMAFVEFFRYFKAKPRAIIRGRSELDDGFAVMLPQYIAKSFGVSHRAALIRLEKLNAIVGKPTRVFDI
jgi:Zn-dependent peptidase ImmA (M78 family)